MHLSGRLYVLMNGREPWKFKGKLLNEESIWGIDTASETRPCCNIGGDEGEKLQRMKSGISPEQSKGLAVKWEG